MFSKDKLITLKSLHIMKISCTTAKGRIYLALGYPRMLAKPLTENIRPWLNLIKDKALEFGQAGSRIWCRIRAALQR